VLIRFDVQTITVLYSIYNMLTTKKLVFCLLSVVFLTLISSAHASADNGRYFVKTTKGFWKSALGVRHNFANGFSANLSDFQVRLAKVFGLDVEPVGVLQILPDKAASSSTDPLDTTVSPINTTPDPSPTATPPPTEIPTPKSIITANKTVRYFPSDQTPWGIETMYDDPLIASTSGGAGINVAVLDTGIYTDHHDLKSRIAQCEDFTSLNFPLIDNKCDDTNGHGTHVAGIISADAGTDNKGIYGVAPESKIFAYKVCDTDGSCYADDIAAAIYMAADQGSNVINMSFGSDQGSPLILDAVNYATSHGVLMVAAAGNDGPFTDSIDYPAAYASVIAVGAINQKQSVTNWSSRGINSTSTPFIVEDGDVEFTAPGEYIESTWNNGSYAILSGTSMASPFVAGLAAKYWQSDPDPVKAAQETRDFLHSLANDIAPVGDDNVSGFGLPQVK
jgi:subtilisin